MQQRSRVLIQPSWYTVRSPLLTRQTLRELDSGAVPAGQGPSLAACQAMRPKSLMHAHL